MRPVANPPNPWASAHVELLEEAPPTAQLEVYEEECQSILSRNDSPDVPFTWSVNPYRGCFHGCAYCYARPSHEYLDWGAGTDFERKIVVKTNAAAMLRRQLRRRSWEGEAVAFSGVTDCYQPVEASYELTQACLKVCVEERNAVGIITKGALIERDIGLLQALAQGPGARVYVSLPFADDGDARALEPYVSLPSRRFRTIEKLAAAGIHVGVAVSPVIPGISDHQIPEILERARDAGAQGAFCILLRLPGSVENVFLERLRESYPERADKVLHGLEQMRGGTVKDSRFGQRMAGSGPRWQVIQQLFTATCRRLGLTTGRERWVPPRNPKPRQGGLFEE